MNLNCDPPNFSRLAERFDVPGIEAVVLVGSFARGDAGPYSDVDLLWPAKIEEGDFGDDGSHLMDERLVVVSTLRPERIEGIFSEPERASTFMAGLRYGRALLDKEGVFAAVQARADDFEWGPTLQKRADAYASEQMVGWVEEVHKGLEGLRRNDIGRLLNARFGLSWGLSDVMRVHKGVLVSGDNGTYDEVSQAMAGHDEWVRLRRCAFGIEDEHGFLPALCQQVAAGLQLYVVTAQELEGRFRGEDRAVIEDAVRLIEMRLDAGSYDGI